MLTMNDGEQALLCQPNLEWSALSQGPCRFSSTKAAFALRHLQADNGHILAVEDSVYFHEMRRA